MAVNMNPENGKAINDYGTTYHKRGENEEMTQEEFIHRLSVFLKTNSDKVERDYIIGGHNRYEANGGDSIFSTPVSDRVLDNAAGYFNEIDTDKSGTISLEELSEYANWNKEGVIAKFAINAYSYDMVPDNPRDIIEEERQNESGKISIEESKQFGL